MMLILLLGERGRCNQSQHQHQRRTDFDVKHVILHLNTCVSGRLPDDLIQIKLNEIWFT